MREEREEICRGSGQRGRGHGRGTALLLALLLALSLAGCQSGGKDASGAGSSRAQGAGTEASDPGASGAARSSAGSSAESDSTAAAGSTVIASEVRGSGADDDPAVAELFAMDTAMTLQAYGDHAVEAVTASVQEIERLDSLLSTGSSYSEISRINQDGGGSVTADTAYLLERSLELHEKTGGAFDISIYPVMQAWGFPTGDYRVPTDDELSLLLQKVDAGKIDLTKKKDGSGEVRFGIEGMEIDLGGIAKGYTSARIMDIYRSYGVKHGLVSLGGNVQLCGGKTDGSDWRVAVRDPQDENSYLGILSLKNRAVITSGAYERNFTRDGVTYHHILDPSTGKPAQSGVISATVISADGTLADGLSTSLYVLGVEGTSDLWRSYSDDFDFVLETEDGTVYVTESVAGKLQTDKTVQVVKKEKK